MSKNQKNEQHRGIGSAARDAFESFGFPDKVRCKICYQAWLEKSVKHAVAHGEDLEAAEKAQIHADSEYRLELLLGGVFLVFSVEFGGENIWR